MHNLAVNLERSASLFPTKAALRMGSDEVSFAQLEQLAGKVATNLERLGLKKGDKVALSCPNVTYFPIAYYGILKAGCVVVPLNVLFKARECLHIGFVDCGVFHRIPLVEVGHLNRTLNIFASCLFSLPQVNSKFLFVSSKFYLAY